MLNVWVEYARIVMVNFCKEIYQIGLVGKEKR